MTVRIPTPPVDAAMGRLGAYVVLIAMAIGLGIWVRFVVNRVLDVVVTKRQEAKLTKIIAKRIGPVVLQLVEAPNVAHREDPAGFAHPASNAIILVIAAIETLRRAGATPDSTRAMIKSATELGLQLTQAKDPPHG